MAEIVLAVDGPNSPDTRAVAASPSSGDAPDQRLVSDWHANLERSMVEFLASVRLQDLVRAQSLLGQRAELPHWFSGGLSSQLGAMPTVQGLVKAPKLT